MTHVTVIRDDRDLIKYQPGEIGKPFQNQPVKESSYWFIGCPNLQCGGYGNLGNHEVIETQGMITISPSILCGCGAHYFIVNNEIQWC